MEMSNAMAAINWLAVLGSAVSAFILGGIWYGPVFGKQWMAANNINEQTLAKRKPAKIFGLSFILMLIAAVNLEMFIGTQGDIGYGACAGFLAGIGWVATYLGVIYLFEMRPMGAYLVNAGYCIVSLTIMGLILGAF